MISLGRSFWKRLPCLVLGGYTAILLELVRTRFRVTDNDGLLLVPSRNTTPSRFIASRSNTLARENSPCMPSDVMTLSDKDTKDSLFSGRLFASTIASSSDSKVVSSAGLVRPRDKLETSDDGSVEPNGFPGKDNGDG